MNQNTNHKIVLIIIVITLLINSLFLGAMAEEIYTESNDKILPEAGLDPVGASNSGEIEANADLAFAVDASEPNQNLFAPLTGSSRSAGILGQLIKPGNYTGSLDASTNQYQFYTMYLNGSGVVTDLVNVRAGTSDSNLGIANFAHPDLFVIDYDFFGMTQGIANFTKAAITTGYHYFAVVVGTGTLNYWVNISVSVTNNPQNDGNNDFGNVTVATGDGSYPESVNFTFDYWDMYEITVPPKKNLTVSAEPSGNLDVDMELYDAPNSSSEHLIMEATDGWGGEPEYLYYDTDSSAVTLYIRVFQYSSPPKQGNYYLNFTLRDPNLRPRVNLTDPKILYWTSSEGIVIDEDEVFENTVMLSQHFIDDGFPQNPGKLSYDYQIVEDPENLTVFIHANSSVTIQPAENWFGSDIIYFYANDSVFEIYDSINLTVNPVNDAPVLKDQDEWAILNSTLEGDKFRVWEGQVASITVQADDVDTNNPINPDSLYYSAELLHPGNTKLVQLPNNFTIDKNTGEILFHPTNSDVGTFYVNISVRDRPTITAGDRKEDWLNVTFIVTNQNNEPSFEKINVKSVDYFVSTNKLNLPVRATQDEEFLFYVFAQDADINTPDGDTLTINIQPSFIFTEQGSAAENVRIYSFTPDNELSQTGFIVANLSVTDAKGEADYLDLTIWINNINDPPEFTKISGVNVPSSKLFEFTNGIDPYGQLNFTVAATDIDVEDELTFSSPDKSLTGSYSPELRIFQAPGERQASIVFDPLARRADSIVTINLTVEDDGNPKLMDWLIVKVTVLPEPVIPPKYTLTKEDCSKAYTDENGDVFIYEKKVEGGISTAKGEYSSIDIITMTSEKKDDNLVITVTFGDNPSSIFGDSRIYVVYKHFAESGLHLNPKNFKESDWDNLPFEPSEDQIIAGNSFDYFELNPLFDLFYISEVSGTTWKITVSLELFEANYGLSHENNQFDFFVRSYDSSKLQIVVGTSKLLGPKAYDSAGFGSANAPEPIKDEKTNGDTSSIAGLSLLWWIIIIVIIVIIIVVLIVGFVISKKRKQRATAGAGQVSVVPEADARYPYEHPPGQEYPQALPPQPGRICQNCGSFLTPRDTTYCPNCGEWLFHSEKTVDIECKECGMRVPEGRYVCPFCSEPLAPEGSRAAGPPPGAPPSPPPGMPLQAPVQDQYPGPPPGQAQVTQEIAYVEAQGPPPMAPAPGPAPAPMPPYTYPEQPPLPPQTQPPGPPPQPQGPPPGPPPQEQYIPPGPPQQYIPPGQAMPPGPPPQMPPPQGPPPQGPPPQGPPPQGPPPQGPPPQGPPPQGPPLQGPPSPGYRRQPEEYEKY